ncbi:YadA-like family protein, partial [Sphingomicrobium lutaoense]
AASMALGGMMVVPDSDVSLSANISTYRGETGFAAGLVARVAPRIYVSGGYAGSSEGGSNGGRVGVAIGF